MEKNLRTIIDNREWAVFSPGTKENESGLRTTSVHRWRRQKRVTSHGASRLDGLSVKVDNLRFVGQIVLHEELLLIEAFLPELLNILVNLQEEEA